MPFPSPILHALQQWLDAGGSRMGEIAIERSASGFTLHHHTDESDTAALALFEHPQDAREIARYDAQGNYRPLKSAPNLRQGWLLKVTGTAELRLALDFFYPAMLGSWLAAREQRLTPVDFRETAARQSGMYAVVKKITDAQADALIGDFCRSDGRCLKTILWKIAADSPVTRLPREKFDLTVDQLTGTRIETPAPPIPLPCAEACNLLVAEARNVVKSSPR